MPGRDGRGEPSPLDKNGALEQWLEYRLRQVRARIRDLERSEERDRRRRERACIEQVWKLQPERAGAPAMLHLGGCGLYKTELGHLDSEESLIALAEPDIEPCEVCRPDAGLRAVQAGHLARRAVPMRTKGLVLPRLPRPGRRPMAQPTPSSLNSGAEHSDTARAGTDSEEGGPTAVGQDQGTTAQHRGIEADCLQFRAALTLGARGWALLLCPGRAVAGAGQRPCD
ncbi:DUF6233 domain-containing protein [Streptomyces sp. NPDC014622]|uniref:DUF6233 domain-containing protein n=2 Tax=unclassified Streptomyces TaxID=2593676 RepID=UPI0036F809AA